MRSAFLFAKLSFCGFAAVFVTVAAAQDLKIPGRLWECETLDQETCASWSFTGTDGTAQGRDGSRGDLIVQQFDPDWIIIRRQDTSGPYSGLTGNYVGKLNGERLEGTVTWTWIGHWTQQRRGTWYATFRESGPKSDPPGHDSPPRPPETPRQQHPPLQLGGDGCDIAVRPYHREEIESRLVPRASGETAGLVEQADRLYAASDYAAALPLYRQAATAGAAQALRRIGAFYDNGYGVGRDLEEALRWYRKAAAAGDPLAMHAIGLMYYTGEGTAKNLDEAIRWFRRAADLSLLSAMHDLAAAYAGKADPTPADIKEALRLSRSAAAAGEPESMYALGSYYALGMGVPQDFGEAARWYRQGAELGSAGAQSSLGLLYQSGQGVAQNLRLARCWYQRAAAQDDPSGLNGIAYMYFNGLGGVPLDRAAALRFNRRAAELGNAYAMNEVGVSYLHGDQVTKDYAEGARWLRRAADLGEPLAMRNLGYVYSLGQGVPKSLDEAIRWLRMAADHDQSDALFDLGRVYQDKGDYSEAMKWYLKAASKGDAAAMNNVGYLWSNGLGVPKNNATALIWVSKAASLGNPDAKENLQNLRDNAMARLIASALIDLSER